MQLALTLLLSAFQLLTLLVSNPNVPQSVRENGVLIAGQAITLAKQAIDAENAQSSSTPVVIPTIDFGAIVPTPAPVPQPLPVPTPQPTPAPQPVAPPDTVVTTTVSGANGITLSYTNNTNRQVHYTSVTIRVRRGLIIEPATSVNVEFYGETGTLVSPQGFSIPVNQITDDFQTFQIPVDMTIQRTNINPNNTIVLRSETHNIPFSSNNKYYIEFVSLNGETFGDKPVLNTNGKTLYTF